MFRKLKMLLAAVLVMLAAACGGGGDTSDDPYEVDYQAWEAELETLYGHEVDFPVIRDVTENEQCPDDLDYTVALAMDASDWRVLEMLRIDIRYACPERSDEVEDIIDSLGG